MTRKTVPALILALVILLIAAISATACSVFEGTKGTAATPMVATVSEKPEITINPTGPSFTPKPSESAGLDDGSWKAKFEADLRENYGVEVDHYEFVGGTSYQAYVKINGEMIPYVCVDAATGHYHG